MNIDTSDYDVSLSAEEQKQKLWHSLLSHNSTADESEASTNNNSDERCPAERKWPTYDSLVSHLATEDYKKNLVCPHDRMSDRDKKICPHGLVACCKMEFFGIPETVDGMTKPYTGLLTPGKTVEHCIIRLSSAIRPLDQNKHHNHWARPLVRNAVGRKLSSAKIFPGVAIKAFRGNNIPSGNLLFLGSKVGQREEDFFAHCVCTSLTEKMPLVALPFVRRFWSYSDHPLSLGISDFAAHDQEGHDDTGEKHNFPFTVTLRPVLDRSEVEGVRNDVAATAQSRNEPQKNFATFDSFIEEATNIPAGTILYEIYASPDPESVRDPTRIQRIGRIVTTSEMIQSAPTDGIFFRHQVKEDDFQLRPEWKRGINRKISMDEGKTKGTVGKLAGWRLFEEDIAEGKYVDFGATSSQKEP